MPIREYKCKNEDCDNSTGFEHLHIRSTDTELTECPLCKSEVTKLMSTFSAKFVGDGFYITDYKDKKKPKTREVNGETKTVTDPKEIRKIKKQVKKNE
jgi:putative FmdB family regulatory protein